jgi:hypothetical protein
MPSKIAERVNGFSKKVTGALPSMSGGFLTNKWMLYLVLFSAIFDIFYFYKKNDMQAILIFLVIGFLVSFFSKNMVVILILAIVFTHLIRFGKQATEGFEDEEDEDKEGYEDGEDADADIIANEGFKKEDEESDKKEKMGDIGKLIETNTELMTEMKQLEPLLSKAEGYLSKKNEGFGDFGTVYEKFAEHAKKPESFKTMYEKFAPKPMMERFENDVNTRSKPR